MMTLPTASTTASSPLHMLVQPESDETALSGWFWAHVLTFLETPDRMAIGTCLLRSRRDKIEQDNNNPSPLVVTEALLLPPIRSSIIQEGLASSCRTWKEMVRVWNHYDRQYRPSLLRASERYGMNTSNLLMSLSLAHQMRGFWELCIVNFAQHVTQVHAWYKHLPLGQGAQLRFYWNFHAHMELLEANERSPQDNQCDTQTRTVELHEQEQYSPISSTKNTHKQGQTITATTNTRRSQSWVKKDQPQHPWDLTTEEYRRRFGFFDYYLHIEDSQNHNNKGVSSIKPSDGSCTKEYDCSLSPPLAWVYSMDDDDNKAKFPIPQSFQGIVDVTAVVHPHAHAYPLYERLLQRVVATRNPDMVYQPIPADCLVFPWPQNTTTALPREAADELAQAASRILMLDPTTTVIHQRICRAAKRIVRRQRQREQTSILRMVWEVCRRNLHDHPDWIPPCPVLED